jgi:hypothetical protein
MPSCHMYTLGGLESKWCVLTDSGTAPQGQRSNPKITLIFLMRRDTMPSIYRWGDFDLKELISIIKGITI